MFVEPPPAMAVDYITGHHMVEGLEFVSETRRTVGVNHVHVIMFLFKYQLFKPTATVSETSPNYYNLH